MSLYWRNSIYLLLLLITTWLLWSGLYTPLLIGLGALSCAVCLYLAHRIGFYDRDVFCLHLTPRLPRYWAWLFLEIIKSSFEIARVILKRELPISPSVVVFEAAPKGPVGQAILGNSITLTPGTVTLDIVRGQMRVHCLTRKGAEDLMSGELNRRAAALTED